MRKRLGVLSFIAASALGAAACSSSSTTDGGGDGGQSLGDAGLKAIGHFVVIYLENHSFDNLYGEFAGADGLPTTSQAQLGPDGTAYTTLPQPVDTNTGMPDPNFPDNLPNKPFDIDQYQNASVIIPDVVHRYYQEQAQINSGGMNYYALISDAKGLAMGYYHTSDLLLASEAQSYTLCDHFFHAAFGGSFLNHQILISAQPPVFPCEQAADAGKISSAVVPLDGGPMANDSYVTPPDSSNVCYAVNTSYSVNTPHPTKPAQQYVPNQTNLTIGDLLSDAGVDWKWYSGGWNAALAGQDDAGLFQYHHQPFIYYANYADGTAAKAAHLKDEEDFKSDIAAGTLPPVSFWKPYGTDNEHPGYAALLTGEMYVEDVIAKLKASPQWDDMAIIITYDENGGFWDHVVPPTVDIWGPGTRVPTIVISPFAKRGYVDTTVYDTTSILTTIEHRWGLPSLGVHDAHFPDMLNSFQQ
jgi:phospholipase C